jgi:hypothetical protein
MHSLQVLRRKAVTFLSRIEFGQYRNSMCDYDSSNLFLFIPATCPYSKISSVHINGFSIVSAVFLFIFLFFVCVFSIWNIYSMLYFVCA